MTSPAVGTNAGHRDAERSVVARIAVTVACVAGLLHAASSLYWAVGGRWLLPTVGAWAVDAAERSPVLAGMALGIIGLLKLSAAIVPVVIAAGRMPSPRFWRAVCWVGAVGIAVYGGVNIAVSGAVLVGVIAVAGGYDEDAMIGHVFIWDPLFFVWGVALIVWLLTSRHAGIRFDRDLNRSTHHPG
ncbi:DUF3995 domain-containing protein [Glaciibacter flavus]|uniref:DUF3995 domain-containing protein n=1 Tax=Orlajensenia flava TaxID=2565934 RepID=UPI003B0097C2